MNNSLKAKLLTTSIMVAVSSAASAATPVVEQLGTGVTMAQTLNSTTLTQTTANAMNTFKTIDTAKGEAFNVILPNAKAISIEKVDGGSPTNFAGALNAQYKDSKGKLVTGGIVVVENGAGITFTKDSQVNVGGLMATTGRAMVLNKNGSYQLSDFSNNGVDFEGTVISAGGVYAMSNHILVGKTARIVAGGNITFAAGTGGSVDLTPTGGITQDSLAADTSDITVSGTVLGNNVSLILKDAYSGLINLSGVVDTGDVSLSSAARGNVNIASDGDVNISGKVISGDDYTKAAGKVTITSKGSTTIDGSIDASADWLYSRAGDVIINSGGATKINSIMDTATFDGYGGNVTINSNGVTNISSINTLGDSNGGTVNIASTGSTSIGNILSSKVTTKSGGDTNISSLGKIDNSDPTDIIYSPDNIVNVSGTGNINIGNSAVISLTLKSDTGNVAFNPGTILDVDTLNATAGQDVNISNVTFSNQNYLSVNINAGRYATFNNNTVSSLNYTPKGYANTTGVATLKVVAGDNVQVDGNSAKINNVNVTSTKGDVDLNGTFYGNVRSSAGRDAFFTGNFLQSVFDFNTISFISKAGRNTDLIGTFETGNLNVKSTGNVDLEGKINIYTGLGNSALPIIGGIIYPNNAGSAYAIVNAGGALLSDAVINTDALVRSSSPYVIAGPELGVIYNGINLTAGGALINGSKAKYITAQSGVAEIYSTTPVSGLKPITLLGQVGNQSGGIVLRGGAGSNLEDKNANGKLAIISQINDTGTAGGISGATAISVTAADGTKTSTSITAAGKATTTVTKPKVKE